MGYYSPFRARFSFSFYTFRSRARAPVRSLATYFLFNWINIRSIFNIRCTHIYRYIRFTRVFEIQCNTRHAIFSFLSAYNTTATSQQRYNARAGASKSICMKSTFLLLSRNFEFFNLQFSCFLHDRQIYVSMRTCATEYI